MKMLKKKINKMSILMDIYEKYYKKIKIKYI